MREKFNEVATLMGFIKGQVKVLESNQADFVKASAVHAIEAITDEVEMIVLDEIINDFFAEPVEKVSEHVTKERMGGYTIFNDNGEIEHENISHGVARVILSGPWARRNKLYVQVDGDYAFPVNMIFKGSE